MNRIYAPWRHQYVTTHERKDKKELLNGCVFCDAFQASDDAQHYILRRFNNTVAMMNLYPYNGGHLMVIPLQHTGDLEELTLSTRTELMEVTTLASSIVKQVTKCQGLNVGLNLGQAGGGGIQEHLHMHVLPRWRGDTNFLATLSDTSLICTDFDDVYKELKAGFDALTDEQLACLK